MADPQRAAIEAWVDAWRRAGPVLEELRRQELRATKTVEAVAALDQACRWALRSTPPQPTSGMIEMQRHFIRFRKLRHA